MAFIPRNFEQILNDMVAHMRANSTVTDFTIGSVARTFLEACALEDDEQYYQMVKLLDAFRIATASGAELDKRAADYNLTRFLPAPSSGEIVISDGSLISNFLRFNAVPGSPRIVSLISTADFPVAPFNIRIGEGTPQVENCSVTLNNTTTNALTVATLVNAHSVGERVSITGSGDRAIPAGITVQVPAAGDSSAIVFSTIVSTTISDGNYDSPPVTVKSLDTGVKCNIASGQITQFQGSGPFTGALVSNRTSMSGGRDLETDEALRARLMRRIRELSRGTVNAVETAALGVTDPVTGKSVVTSKLREDLIDPNNHILYVDDGSGFTPTKVLMPQTTLSVLHGGGVTVLQVASVAGFSDNGYVLIDPNGASSEYVRYTSQGPGNVLNLPVGTLNAHALGQTVLVVDLVGVAEEGQNFFRLHNWPILSNTADIYDNNTGTFLRRVNQTDYILNRTNGDLQYQGYGLFANSTVLAHYSYYTGLLALVQKVITGDPNDRINYPGVAAGGIAIHVGTPVIRRISVAISITAMNGYDELQLRGLVQRDIEAYIDGLMIGDNVYRAKIIETAMGVLGVENAILVNPTADIVILENELPTPYDIYGNSLVQVL